MLRSADAASPVEGLRPAALQTLLRDLVAGLDGLLLASRKIPQAPRGAQAHRPRRPCRSSASNRSTVPEAELGGWRATRPARCSGCRRSPPTWARSPSSIPNSTTSLCSVRSVKRSTLLAWPAGVRRRRRPGAEDPDQALRLRLKTAVPEDHCASSGTGSAAPPAERPA